MSGPSQQQWDAMLRQVASQMPLPEGTTFSAPENELRPDPARLAQEIRLLNDRLKLVETFLAMITAGTAQPFTPSQTRAVEIKP